MTDPQPRIFRRLEKETGRDGFDTIVAAAVTAFAALRHPGRKHASDFARLVVPLWDKIGPETKRAAAGALAVLPQVPPELSLKILAEPAEIADAFRNPVAAAPSPAPQPERRDSRAQAIRPHGETTATPAPQAGLPATAEDARIMLRRLVQAGPSPAAPAPASAAARTTHVTGILSAARSGEAGAAYAEIATLLGRGPDFSTELAADRTGDVLASALKAIGVEDADAMTAVILLKPRIGLNIEAFERMKDFYRSLSADACHARLGLPPVRTSRPAAPALKPQALDIDRPLRSGTARAPFGRRQVLPSRGLAVGGER
ncbi:hypothetical protein [Aurantimonas sp. VKM B-3413]|uniref:hypothetical protein n=1 Tax=Aurantimonas sp. VKM B-3413 TaxID=2779401 RepID=UPI001E47C7BA|nr:hypothetical protein [Aurantimonas sp. VKM B-3413]MCB8838270.1 hypothetical protein [Aurantimonas sp. VKM B-3413]